MSAHNMEDAGVNKSSKSLWNGKILYILIPNMEPIKLQCISSVELKNAGGTSQVKTKLG